LLTPKLCAVASPRLKDDYFEEFRATCWRNG